MSNQANVSRETEIKLTPVVTIAPAKLEDNTMMLAWSRRSTEANPVKTQDRYRGINVPVASLTLPDGATTSKFSALLQTTIFDLADKCFTAWVKDNMLVTEVDATRFNLDAVIRFWAEEKRSAQIDAAKVAEWLKTSKTYEALTEEVKKVWLVKIPKIAAPSYTTIFTKAQAATIVSKIHPDDIDHPVANFIATRCNTVITKESQEEAL